MTDFHNFNVRIPALEKLVDYVASGIGSTAGHLFAGKIARREVEARLIAAQGEIEAQRILTEGQATTMQVIANAQAEARSTLVSPDALVEGQITIGELITQRIQFQEEKRQANIGAVVRQASLRLEDKEVYDYEVDHDWTARFFNEVQDVSSGDLQSLWAKVLAGEIEQSGSTSIKTLNVLRNLDKRAADLIVKLCSACVTVSMPENGLLDARVPFVSGYKEGNALGQYGLDYGKLIALQEHGIVTSDLNSWHDYNACIEPWVSEPKVGMLVCPFSFQSQYWVLSPTAERPVDEEFRLPGVALTRSGWELSNIVDLEPMADYFQALMEFFSARKLRMTQADSSLPWAV